MALIMDSIYNKENNSAAFLIDTMVSGSWKDSVLFLKRIKETMSNTKAQLVTDEKITFLRRPVNIPGNVIEFKENYVGVDVDGYYKELFGDCPITVGLTVGCHFVVEIHNVENKFPGVFDNKDVEKLLKAYVNGFIISFEESEIYSSALKEKMINEEQGT